MTLVTSAAVSEDRAARWLVLGSLALNLFFVGAGGALLARHYLATPAVTSVPYDRTVSARIERLAATLPATDADILRAEFHANAGNLEASRAGYRNAQDEVRRILRTEPFQSDAMRAAMTQQRAARQVFDQLLQDVIAAAAAKMSGAGRNKLADWPPGQRSANDTKSR